MTKIHSKEVEMTRMAKVIGNILDVETRIILSKNVRNHRETRTKRLSLEVLGAITVRKMMKRLKTKLVSWLMHLASASLFNVTDIHKTKSICVNDTSSVDACLIADSLPRPK
ncbi:hypothetical protein Tco_0562587 [Tanacetum coccineum]